MADGSRRFFPLPLAMLSNAFSGLRANRFDISFHSELPAELADAAPTNGLHHGVIAGLHAFENAEPPFSFFAHRAFTGFAEVSVHTTIAHKVVKGPGHWQFA